MTQTIVPDAIEPYRGYKALTVDDRGYLLSPQRNTLWPCGEKLTAACLEGHINEVRWRPLTVGECPPAKCLAIYHVPPGQMLSVQFQRGLGEYTLPPLPDGCDRWAAMPVPTEHSLVCEECSCGIYLVNDPLGCLSYMRDAKDRVLVEVALWGTVIPAAKGARGEFAYPQRILVPEHLRGDPSVARAAERYQIPCEPLHEKWDRLFYGDRRQLPEVRAELRKRQREDASIAASSFSLLAALTALSTTLANDWLAPPWENLLWVIFSAFLLLFVVAKLSEWMTR